jgi:undecaprenyl diphosphate synthase
MVAIPRPQPDPSVVPEHVAVIMDGNGRWARRRALPRQAGHQAGIRPLRKMVERCARLGVRALTVFAFSTENWQRPREEIGCLMALFIDALEREVAELDRSGIRLKFIGNLALLDARLREAVAAAEARTAGNARMDLIVAVAYGGRWDVTQAARKLAQAVAEGCLDPADIDEQYLAGALTTAGLPGVDLLIRTGGEHRISNFLLWDLAYSEVYFSDVLWPDFAAAELDRAFEFYTRRQRRFGRTGEQVEAARC